MSSKLSYWLTFYNRNNEIDRIVECESDTAARRIMNKYNVIDSGNLYSRITLNCLDGENSVTPKKLTELLHTAGSQIPPSCVHRSDG